MLTFSPYIIFGEESVQISCSFLKCRYIPHLLIVRAIIFKMFILLIMVHRFNTISFKALVGYYLDINKLILESNALH